MKSSILHPTNMSVLIRTIVITIGTSSLFFFVGFLLYHYIFVRLSNTKDNIGYTDNMHAHSSYISYDSFHTWCFTNNEQSPLDLEIVRKDQIISGYNDYVFSMGAVVQDTPSPIGLLISNGVLYGSLADGNSIEGNDDFFLRPNGVFVVDKLGQINIMETSVFRFFYTRYDAIYTALQSGPLLVSHGSIHPLLNPSSSIKKMRSAVGRTKDGDICFVATKSPTNMYDIGSFMKNDLSILHALQLQGGYISRFDKDIGSYGTGGIHGSFVIHN